MNNIASRPYVGKKVVMEPLAVDPYMTIRISQLLTSLRLASVPSLYQLPARGASLSYFTASFRPCVGCWCCASTQSSSPMSASSLQAAITFSSSVSQRVVLGRSGITKMAMEATTSWNYALEALHIKRVITGKR